MVVKRLDDQRAKHRKTAADLGAEHKAREEALKREVLELKLQVRKLQDLHFGKSSMVPVAVVDNGHRGKRITHRTDPGFPVTDSAGNLLDPRLDPIRGRPASSLWNESVSTRR